MIITEKIKAIRAIMWFVGRSMLSDKRNKTVDIMKLAFLTTVKNEESYKNDMIRRSTSAYTMTLKKST